MVIQNGKIFHENGKFEKRELHIEEGFIVNETKNSEVVDATGLYVIPGLIDIHFHGCVGRDFCDASHESIAEMAKYQLQNGITAICPASMTLSIMQLKDIFRCAASYRGDIGAELVGIYMEGPFLSKDKKGAQAETYLCNADIRLFEELQNAADGMIKVVAVAPEETGAFEFIDAVSSDVRVSIAHTCADYDMACQAFAKGVKQVTHLYNGMNGYHHRAPGVIGASCDYENVMVELICDGVHIHPSVVRTTYKMYGNDRIIMVSDSMSACGLENGDYYLGGQEVCVCDKTAVLKDSNVLAGSVTNLMDCMKTAVKEMGIPLESAVKSVTMNPAKAIDVYDEMGSITVGKKANLVLLDEELNIRHVIKDGIIIR